MAEITFSFTTEDYEAPFLQNQSPADGTAGITTSTVISVDILDDGTIDLSSVDAYVNGLKVFEGPGTFISPFNGPQSAIVATFTDGYNGYNLKLDNAGGLDPSETYEIRVVARDMAGNAMDEDFSFITTTHIESVTLGPYEITLDITFGAEMDGLNSALTIPANYVFDNGAYARYVEAIDDETVPTVVRLWVEQLYGTENFTLTISDDVKDSNNESLLSPYNSTTVSPLQSSASYGNYNGKVRTWRESNLIEADDERVYLAGSKGIDILHKEEGENSFRWAQIFSEYDIKSMFVAHFGTDHSFTDTTPPSFSYRDPFPGTTVSESAGAVINFKLFDSDTAVEITSIIVYINEVLAFSGSSGGWKNNFYGYIVVNEYKTIDVTIQPPTPFSQGEDVEVRVLAQDLLGNEFDASYTYTIGVTALGAGFGGSKFGVSSFGGV